MPFITTENLAAELEALTFAPGKCTECGDDTQVYHDRETGANLCLDCLEGAVDDERCAVDNDEWDTRYRMVMLETEHERAAAAQTALPAPSTDWPF